MQSMRYVFLLFLGGGDWFSRAERRFLVMLLNFRGALLLNDFILNVNNRIAEERDFLDYYYVAKSAMSKKTVYIMMMLFHCKRN